MSETADSWKKFLDPEALKGNLIAIGLFISSYELFRSSVIDKPRYFFSDGFDKDGPIVSDEYKENILSLSRSPLHGSLLWLKEMGAIDESDIETYEQVKRHRNELTHELLEFVSDSKKEIDIGKFGELLDLYKKIEKWWFINFELSIDPEILPEGTSADDVTPGPIWTLQLMYDIALGNEPESGYYYKNFVQMTRNN